jgi:hypothetical protein
MSATLINVIIQLIAGAVGGNAVGAGLKNFDLGTLGNTIAGALGGAGGARFSPRCCRSFRAQPAGSISATVGGGGAGAIVTAIVGLIKNAMARKRRDKRQGEPGDVFKRRRVQLRT